MNYNLNFFCLFLAISLPSVFGVAYNCRSGYLSQSGVLNETSTKVCKENDICSLSVLEADINKKPDTVHFYSCTPKVECSTQACTQVMTTLSQLVALQTISTFRYISCNASCCESNLCNSGIPDVNKTIILPASTKPVVVSSTNKTMVVMPTEPDPMKPDMTKPDMTKPDMTKPDMTKPDMTKPDMTKPDMPKPDMTKPDMTKPADLATAPTNEITTVISTTSSGGNEPSSRFNKLSLVVSSMISFVIFALISV